MARYRWALPVALVLLSAVACSPRHEFAGSPYQDPAPAPALGLKTTNGNEFSWADHQGEAVMLYFGYTNCPDVCPATLSKVDSVLEQLGSDSDRASFVFVTIDPARDSAEVVRQYLDKFNTRFIGLVGTAGQIEVAKSGYGVFAEPEDENDEHSDMTHTARVFLIDPDGKLVSGYTFDEPANVILKDVEFLIGDGS
jgi:protein SCO1/2